VSGFALAAHCALRTAVPVCHSTVSFKFRTHGQKYNRTSCSRKTKQFFLSIKFLFTKQLNVGRRICVWQCYALLFFLQKFTCNVTLQKDHNDRYIISTALLDRRVHLIKPKRQTQRIMSETGLFIIQRIHQCRTTL